MKYIFEVGPHEGSYRIAPVKSLLIFVSKHIYANYHESIYFTISYMAGGRGPLVNDCIPSCSYIWVWVGSFEIDASTSLMNGVDFVTSWILIAHHILQAQCPRTLATRQ